MAAGLPGDDRGTSVPTGDHTVAERSENSRESGAEAAAGKTLTFADGGHPGTVCAVPHREAAPATAAPAESDRRSFTDNPQDGCDRSIARSTSAGRSTRRTPSRR